jgi:hypothetical protein
VEEGELARVSGVFTDLESGEAIDPDVVRFLHRRGEGDTATLTYGDDAEVVREEAGVYHVDVPTEDEGVLRWRWESAGDFIGVSEGQVTVLASGVL